MHEITREPVVTSTKTLISEVGQDGQVIAELNLTVDNGRLANWKWTLHHIDDRIRSDAAIARLVDGVRKPFLSGANVTRQVNPFNGTKLARPIDTVVGRTKVALHRMNFSSSDPAAVIEGSSHVFLTDAFRNQAAADIAAIRGFRYGTVVRPGPIRLEDLYHFIPIGPLIAKGTIKGRQLKNQIENSIDGSLNPDVAKWTGGWLFNFSGVRAEIDPYAKAGERAKNIQVMDRQTRAWHPLNPEADYTYASYYYARDPDLINTVPAQAISVVKDKNGGDLDAVEVVARYLASLPNRTTAPQDRPAQAAQAPARRELRQPRNSTVARRHTIGNTDNTNNIIPRHRSRWHFATRELIEGKQRCRSQQGLLRSWSFRARCAVLATPKVRGTAGKFRARACQAKAFCESASTDGRLDWPAACSTSLSRHRCSPPPTR